MSKEKFVKYVELNPDDHTDYMLRNYHEDAPNSITDKQLENYHFGVDDLTTEKLLEKTRTGAKDVVIEKSFDSKGLYGSNHRNSSTYDGNISKLEAKRVKEYNIEGEKYELASETPKGSRWWEIKSEDGLKIASKKRSAMNKVAIWDDDDDDDDDDDYDGGFEDLTFEEQIKALDPSSQEGFERDHRLDIEDEEFTPDTEDIEDEEFTSDTEPKELKKFDLTNYEENNDGGTTLFSGEIVINSESYDGPNDPELKRGIVDFILDKKSLNVSPESIDIKFLDGKLVATFNSDGNYSIPVTSFSIVDRTVKANFSITDLSSDFPIFKKAKKK